MSNGIVLTKNMQDALEAVAYGVRKYSDGYRQIEDIEKKVDGRSLEALHRRGLITWRSVGGHTPYIELGLTEEGNRIFEEEIRYRKRP